MSVSYRRVNYYSLGKPYYDNKVIPPRPPECFEIYKTPQTGKEEIEQKYYRTTDVYEIQGRTPYVSTACDVVCNTTNYLSYLSEDGKFLFSKFKDYNGSLDIYCLFNINQNPIPVITWLNCGDVVDATTLFINTLCVIGVSGCDWVDEYNGYYFPKNGLNSISGSITMGINYLSC